MSLDKELLINESTLTLKTLLIVMSKHVPE